VPKRILIAEDEFDIRFMLEQLLKLEGFEVQGVDNGRRALQALREQEFDLLILDIMMPELDGYGVLKELGPSTLSRMKIVILSAKTTEEDIVRGYSVGVAQYVTKPFDNEHVIDIVRYLIGDISAQERAELRKRIDMNSRER
jgi:DNA-binding response OmpR family regulator